MASANNIIISDQASQIMVPSNEECNEIYFKNLCSSIRALIWKNFNICSLAWADLTWTNINRIWRNLPKPSTESGVKLAGKKLPWVLIFAEHF